MKMSLIYIISEKEISRGKTFSYNYMVLHEDYSRNEARSNVKMAAYMYSCKKYSYTV